MTDDIPLLLLGTWTMGGMGFGPYDQDLAVQTLKLYYDEGGRHFDTAQFYAKGESDALLAAFLKDKNRQDVFISSKGGLYWKGNSVYHDGSFEALRKSLEQSLDQFNTDYLDLYQLHWPDPNCHLDIAIDALKAFKKEGKIKHWGISNPNLHYLSYFSTIDNCFTQLHFNPLHQQTKDIAEKNHHSGFKTLVTSPFEQGLLVNPTYLETKLGKKDTRNRNPHFSVQNSSFLRSFFDADTHGFTYSEIILTWIRSFEFVDSIILGCRTPDQLRDCLGIRQHSEEIQQSIKESDAYKLLSVI